MTGDSQYHLLGFKVEEIVALEHARAQHRVFSVRRWLRELVAGRHQLTETERIAMQRFVNRKEKNEQLLYEEYLLILKEVEAEAVEVPTA